MIHREKEVTKRKMQSHRMVQLHLWRRGRGMAVRGKALLIVPLSPFGNTVRLATPDTACGGMRTLAPYGAVFVTDRL